MKKYCSHCGARIKMAEEKFNKGDKVKTPDGIGTIFYIDKASGKNRIDVKVGDQEMAYSEDKLVLI